MLPLLSVTLPIVQGTQDGDPATAKTGFWLWLEQHQLWAQLIGVGGLVVIAALVLLLVRLILLPLLRRLITRTRFTWDDAFLDARFFRWLCGIFPALVMWSGVNILRSDFYLDENAYAVVRNMAAATMVLSAILAVCGFFNALQSIYQSRSGNERRPIKGYVQLAKIFVVVIGVMIMIAVLLGRDVGALMTGVGAMTAVLMLIFKDTILSAVASVQLVNQNMLRIGDWIEMPSVGADGDVIDVALHTVKVQNFDKTISTIPTYKLVTDTFRNWRGMSESGGRRIKRSIHIDLATVRFLDKRDLTRFARFDVLKDYMAEKSQALADSNAAAGKGGLAVNQRRLTNLGTFRAYLIHYLKRHPMIHPGMTFLVRQLQPTELGVPLEIYLFTSTTAWGEYEAIQADIFDHLLAVLPEFGLRAYQRPSGADFAGQSLAE